MKFILLIHLATVIIAFASLVLSAVTSSPRVSFKSNVQTIVTNTEVSTLTPEESAFFATMWVDGFNQVFDTYNVTVLAAVPSSPDRGRIESRTPSNNSMLVSTLAVSGKAVHHGEDLQSILSQAQIHVATLIRLFETLLCHSLRMGPVESFHSAATCIVTLSPSTTTTSRTGSHQQKHQNLRALVRHSINETSISELVETILFGLHSTMACEEIQYYDDMWREAFNELHDPHQAHVDNVEVEQQILYQYNHTQGGTRRRGLQRTSSGLSSIYYYTRVLASCRGCADDSLDLDLSNEQTRDDGRAARRLSLLSFVIESRARLLETEPALFHRQFELNLCGKLRFGPLPYFYDVEDCIVDII